MSTSTRNTLCCILHSNRSNFIRVTPGCVHCTVEHAGLTRIEAGTCNNVRRDDVNDEASMCVAHMQRVSRDNRICFHFSFFLGFTMRQAPQKEGGTLEHKRRREKTTHFRPSSCVNPGNVPAYIERRRLATKIDVMTISQHTPKT